MTVGVALIGGGIWAKEEHLPAIQESKDLVLKAIYSRSLKSAKSVAEEAHGVELYSEDSGASFNDLIKRPDIDAVVIALPIGNQSQYIRAALLAGKHVLSEKPIAENLREAEELIRWYRTELKTGASWCVAENWRFLDSFAFAKEEISKLGRILGFRVRIYDNIQQDGKFFQTSWRKTPTYQGGFLLDGGVHYIAGIRQLLDWHPRNRVARVAAFTTMLQGHLPPVDTMNAIFQVESGVSGTFQQSVGTSLTGPEWTVGCENGVVTVADSKVTITANGSTETKVIPDERTGVPPEIRAWGQALIAGTVIKEQQPEEALADLELIELMLRSGEKEGLPMACQYQTVKIR